MEPTADPAAADVILFNTCSVREKAQEKVFSDLGRAKEHKLANPHVLIGVGGCVASQEGSAIVARAPYVDLVFGPQTLHRLPQMIEARRATGKPQVDVSFPAIEKFDDMPPARVEGAAAFVSVMEGCSKYCSFCVVPYTRGEEVSRPFEGVLVEVAELAQQHGIGRGNRRPGPAARIRRGDSRCRTHPLHHFAPERIHPAPDRRPRGYRPACSTRPPARASGLGPRARGNEAWLHRAGIPVHRAPATLEPPRYLDFFGFHRRLPRRDRRRL